MQPGLQPGLPIGRERPGRAYDPAPMIFAPIALAALVALAPSAPTAAQAAPGPAAPGQSVSDLRQEIDRLRKELSARDADLAAALGRIKELESQLAAAKGASSAPAESAAPAPAPVPADPSIGPGGLLASVQADYLGSFPSVPDAGDPQKLNLHLRALENWCTKENREGIGQHAWTGRIDPGSVQVSGRDVAFTAIFTNGSKDYKVPVTAEQSVLARVRTRDGLETGPVTMTGVVRPMLRVNPARPAPGAFENPPLVAPYVEFFYQFDLKSVVPAARP